MDPFEPHPEMRKISGKEAKKVLTEQEIFAILDTEIKQFKRSDNILFASLIEKIKEKIGKING